MGPESPAPCPEAGPSVIRLNWSSVEGALASQTRPIGRQALMMAVLDDLLEMLGNSYFKDKVLHFCQHVGSAKKL